MPSAPVLYFDLGSPFSYLAAERAGRVLGVEPSFQPVLLGAIFALRGHGSWSDTAERGAGMAEVERRAAACGLPPVRWPSPWPANTLKAMRAATWAQEQGAGREFALVAFRRAFADGDDLADAGVIAAIGTAVGLDVLDAIERQEVKERLRGATDAAYAAGVVGVPCVAVGDSVLYGDDQLERAATLLR